MKHSIVAIDPDRDPRRLRHRRPDKCKGQGWKFDRSTGQIHCTGGMIIDEDLKKKMDAAAIRPPTSGK